MEKSTFLFFAIETVIFLIPIIALFIKIGGYKKMLDSIEGFSEWKATVDTKINALEENDKIQNSNLAEMNKTLIEINTNVKLLLDGRIKIEGV